MNTRREYTKSGTEDRESSVASAMVEAGRYLKAADFVKNSPTDYMFLKRNRRYSETKRILDAKYQDVLGQITFAGQLTGTEADMVIYDMETNLLNDGISSYYEDYRKYRPGFFSYLNRMGTIGDLRMKLKEFIGSPYDHKLTQYKLKELNTSSGTLQRMKKQRISFANAIGGSAEDLIDDIDKQIQKLEREILYTKYK